MGTNLTDICSVTVPARAHLLPALDVAPEDHAEALEVDSVVDTAESPVQRHATSAAAPIIMRAIARRRQ
jgi:hypothetical protein